MPCSQHDYDYIYTTCLLRIVYQSSTIRPTMFSPRYTITDQLLAQIKRINVLIGELNHRRFPQVVLFEMERTANAVSTYASTSIEGNPLPLTEVKKLLKSAPRNLRQSEQEVLNYNRALETLNRNLHGSELPLTMDRLLSIHAEVMAELLSPYQVGHWRVEPVVVNDARTGQAIYLPPDAKDVEPLMQDLVEFVQQAREGMDPLILARIFHKQFVIIHPFMDGNGRTTRLATKVLLAQMGLDTFNLFSFENYYNQNVTRYSEQVGVKGNYYDIAGAVDLTPWLEYFTAGIVDELLRVQKQLPQVSATPRTQLDPHHRKILDLIQRRGFVRDRDYATVTPRARPTRNLDFKKLIGLGLIVRRGKGKATYYTLAEAHMKAS